MMFTFFYGIVSDISELHEYRHHMKIIVYCQHVLGIGHFFRTLEICRQLKRHDVLLVTGGPEVDAAMPDHIRMVRLPGLRMSREFKGLYPTDGAKSLDETKSERIETLWTLFSEEKPDLFLMELYPFGRKAFRFEIDPVLEGIRSKALPPATVVCSVRDILVEREDSEKYEKRVLQTLNRYVDAVLVHGDPNIVRLDETFFRIGDIGIPVVYTGYVAPRPRGGDRFDVRRKLNLDAYDKLIVVSAGGGKVGEDLMRAALEAVPLMNDPGSVSLQVVTGPYLDQKAYDALETLAGSVDRSRILRFIRDFLSFLAAADLSISMAGYNTCMNILTTKVPAVVWPFPQNQEQRMRAERLERCGLLRVIGKSDLEPARLAKIMDRTIGVTPNPKRRIDLDGALCTAEWVESFIRRKPT